MGKSARVRGTAKKAGLNPNDEFDDAFDVVLSIDIKKEELAKIGDDARERSLSLIRELEARITPPKKQIAADDRRPIIAKCLEGIRRPKVPECFEGVKRHGAPDNLTYVLSWLRSEGALTKTRFGKKYPISDTTARTVVRSFFGVKGRSGKPTRLK